MLLIAIAISEVPIVSFVVFSEGYRRYLTLGFTLFVCTCMCVSVFAFLLLGAKAPLRLARVTQSHVNPKKFQIEINEFQKIG